MNKELIIILKHLLDKTDPEWKNNLEVVGAMITINSASKKFVPPTLEEVTQELKKQNVRGYQEQAQKFWNFYDAKGWMIGKNKMKSWKSAIKTWNFDKNNFIV